MAGRKIALLRGINVGKAKRLAMADLRKLFEKLGYKDVRTLLNSGNVVFTDTDAAPTTAAQRIEKEIAAKLGVTARVTVVTSAQLARAVTDNPLLETASNPSRLLVAFLNDLADRKLLKPLLEQDWAPEALAIGARVVYMWCPDGIIDSRLGQAVNRLLGTGVTARNWATVLKLHALCDGSNATPD